MTPQATQPTLLGRAARMLLVFLLVFGMSFRAEMALAAIDKSSLKDHEENTLTDLTVKEVSGDKIGDAVRSLTEARDDKNEDGITLDYGESVELAAVPEWEGKEEKAIANFVEWDVDGEESTDATVEVTNDKAEGGTVMVTCSLSKEDAAAYLDESLDGTREVSIPVTLNPEPVVETHQVVGEMKCLLVGPGLVEGENSLKLTLDQGKSYQFTAKVTANVNTVDSAGNIVSTESFAYSSDSGTSLAEASNGLLKNLNWELFDGKDALDAGVATIDQDGLLAVAKDSEFLVQCTLADAEGQNAVPFQLEVTCGNPSEKPTPDDPVGPDGPDNPDDPDDPKPDEPGKADQGAEHPQDSLHVTGRVSASAMAAGVDASDDGSTDADSKGEQEAAISDKGDEAVSSSSSSSTEKKSDVKELDKTFSLDEIEALDSSQETYDMRSFEAGDITVTGEGPTLEALFKSMGIENLEGVHEVKFVDYAKGEVTVSWNALSNAMLAVSSYVHDPEPANGKGGDAPAPASPSPALPSAEGQDGASDGTGEDGTADGKVELLPNTRFRVLSNSLASAGIDADSLRWIAEIEINPGKEVEPEPEPEPEPKAPFTVKVGYAPSPIGKEAVFWPIPSKEIAGATFEYVWEESADEGETWEKVSENQTYRTITTKERIGHWFRVTLKSDMVDEATGKKINDTSDPEVMIEGWGISLVYDPPIAGDLATFSVEFTGFPADFKFNTLEYIWELSTDGCETWQKLAPQYQGKSTLSIQTDPIDESDESAESVTPTYIHCRVVGESLKPVTGSTVKIAGPQMLTVHTGGSSSDDPEKKPPEKAKPVSTVRDDSDKNNNKDKNNDTKDDDGDPIKHFAGDDDVVGEDDDDDGDDGDDATTPTPDGASEPSDNAPAQPMQLHINDAVTAQILEQEAAVQERIEETVPGARWTALNASQPSGDDVQGILADNPFVPFAIPTGLGITVAGGLEKLLTFRRQL